jgi:hypothetical protein
MLLQFFNYLVIFIYFFLNKIIRAYERFLEKKYTWTIYITLTIHILLPLIEEPSNLKVSFWLPCCIELFCLTIYSLRWYQLYSFQTYETFKGDKKNYASLITIIVSNI